jgi:hypothetical protein
MCIKAFLEVKKCSKALLVPIGRYGKSPCFLDPVFLRLLGPDYPLSILPYVDGEKFLECAF